jgi:hypothetical protein
VHRVVPPVDADAISPAACVRTGTDGRARPSSASIDGIRRQPRVERAIIEVWLATGHPAPRRLLIDAQARRACGLDCR